MTSQIKLRSTNKPTDFTFCEIPKTNYPQKQGEDDNQFAFSPRLWSKNINSNCICPSSPMMAMVEGRRELMESLNDLPESCYELSLKDMVSKDHIEPELKENKKDANKGAISRSVSLDTGVILLKMFVPSSFGFKKHKVSRSTSMDGLHKHRIDAKQCKNRVFEESKSDTNNKSCNNNRRYTTAAIKNRYAEETLKPGCWSRIRSTSQKGCILF